MWSPSLLVLWSLCSGGWRLGGEDDGRRGRRGGSTVALHKRGGHDDWHQEGQGAGWVQRDARSSGGRGGVGGTAVRACCHGGGVGV